MTTHRITKVTPGPVLHVGTFWQRVGSRIRHWFNRLRGKQAPGPDLLEPGMLITFRGKGE